MILLHRDTSCLINIYGKANWRVKENLFVAGRRAAEEMRERSKSYDVAALDRLSAIERRSVLPEVRCELDKTMNVFTVNCRFLMIYQLFSVEFPDLSVFLPACVLAILSCQRPWEREEWVHQRAKMKFWYKISFSSMVTNSERSQGRRHERFAYTQAGRDAERSGNSTENNWYLNKKR